MGEISISQVSNDDYRRYLSLVDNQDGKVSEKEAKRALKIFTKTHPGEESQKFLEFLEGSGYAFPHQRKIVLAAAAADHDADHHEKSFFSSRCGDKGMPRDCDPPPDCSTLLKIFDETGVIAKFGLDRINRALAKLQKRLHWWDKALDFAYLALSKAAQSGVFDTYTIEEIAHLLISLDKGIFFSYDDIRAVYHLVGVLAEKGCFVDHSLREIEKFIFSIMNAAGDEYVYFAAEKMIGAMDAGPIDLASLSNNLNSLAAYLGDDFYRRGHGLYYALGVMAEQGFVQQYGFEPIKGILQQIGNIDGFINLAKIARKNLFSKIGIEHIVKVAADNCASWDSDAYCFAFEWAIDCGLAAEVGFSRILEVLEKATSCHYSIVKEKTWTIFGKMAQQGMLDAERLESFCQLIECAEKMAIRNMFDPKVLDALENLVDAGFAREIGINGLLVLVGESAVRSDDEDAVIAIFNAIMQLGREDILVKLGTPNLLKLRQALEKETPTALLALIPINQAGLLGQAGSLANEEASDAITGLLIFIGKNAKHYSSDSFVELGKLAESGAVQTIGIHRLKQICQSYAGEEGEFSGDNFAPLFASLQALESTNLIEEIGVDRLTALAAKTRGYTPDALYALEALVEQGAIEEIGLESVIAFLVSVAPESYPDLAKLAKAGVVREIGIGNLIKIFEITGGYADEGVRALPGLEAAGIIRELGADNLIRIFQETGGYAGDVLSALQALAEAHPIWETGSPRQTNFYLLQIITAATGCDAAAEALGALKSLADAGLLEQYGLSRIANFLITIAKADKKFALSSYGEVGNLARNGLIKTIGLNKLAALANLHKDETYMVYSVLGWLSDDQLGGKISMDNLLALATSMHFIPEGGLPVYTPSCDELFSEYQEMYAEGLVQKIGISNLVAIAQAAGFASGRAFAELRKLEEIGLINKLGVAGLRSIAQSAEEDTADTFEQLAALEAAGLFEKFGSHNVLELARVGRQKTSDYLKGIMELENWGLLDRLGVPAVMELAHNAFPFFGEVPAQLKLMADASILDSIGIDWLAEVSRRMRWATAEAYSVIYAFAQNGYLERYGRETVLSLMSDIRECISVPTPVVVKWFPHDDPFDEIGGGEKVQTLLADLGLEENYTFESSLFWYAAHGRGKIEREGFYAELGEMAVEGETRGITVEKVETIIKRMPGVPLEYDAFGKTDRQISTFYNNAPFLALAKLAQEKLVNIIGLPNLLKIARAAGDCTAQAFGLLLNLSKANVPIAENITQIERVIKKIVQLRGNRPGEALDEIGELYISGLLADNGLDGLESLVDAAGENLGAVIHAMLQIEEQDAVSWLGISGWQEALISIVKAAGKKAEIALSALLCWLKGGQLDKYEIPAAQELLVAIGQETGPRCEQTYFAACQLVYSDVLKETSFGTLLQVVHDFGPKAYQEFERLAE